MMKYFKVLVFLLFCVFLTSCLDRNKYPIEPHIEFVSFEKINNGTNIDSEGILTVSFTDGDSDLGNLDAKDSTINCFIIYQEKQHGVYITPNEPAELVNAFNASLPHFISSGKKQAIDGKIERLLMFNNPTSIFDTVRFKCWLVDRTNHESNRIFTPEIVVKKR